MCVCVYMYVWCVRVRVSGRPSVCAHVCVGACVGFDVTVVMAIGELIYCIHGTVTYSDVFIEKFRMSEKKYCIT